MSEIKQNVSWQKIGTYFHSMAGVSEIFRWKVPGGWILMTRGNSLPPGTMTFYPDAEHKWDGKNMQ